MPDIPIPDDIAAGVPEDPNAPMSDYREPSQWDSLVAKAEQAVEILGGSLTAEMEESNWGMIYIQAPPGSSEEDLEKMLFQASKATGGAISSDPQNWYMDDPDGPTLSSVMSI